MDYCGHFQAQLSKDDCQKGEDLEVEAVAVEMFKWFYVAPLDKADTNNQNLEWRFQLNVKIAFLSVRVIQ